MMKRIDYVIETNSFDLGERPRVHLCVGHYSIDKKTGAPLITAECVSERELMRKLIYSFVQSTMQEIEQTSFQGVHGRNNPFKTLHNTFYFNRMVLKTEDETNNP